MKICLIKPPILHKGASFALMPTAPLGLAYIAGALKKERHELQVVDATAEGINNTELFKENVFVFGLNKESVTAKIKVDTQIICFSFMFTNNWMYDREVIQTVRLAFPNAVLVAGGEHVTAAPVFSMTQASGLDYIVLGEGEETIISLINAIEKNEATDSIAGIVFRKDGHILQNKKKARIAELNGISWPAWEFFPVNLYFEHRMSHGVFRGNTLPVMASRGCPYDCTFCSSPQMWGRKYQIRSAKDFVDELEYLYSEFGAVNFDLYDLTAIIYRDWTIEMCQEIVRRELKISFQLPSGTRSEAIDFEVSKHLFEAGCKNITYAPESGSKKVLQEVRKKVKIPSMLKSISHSNAAGLNVHLNRIIGFPDDRHIDMIHTLLFLIKCSWNGANDVAIAVFTPYPGSVLFDRLSQNGELDLYNDNCLMEIIDSYDLWPSKVYSKNISGINIKLYVFLLLISFYGSNYLFRPWRLIVTLRNLINNKHESRLEQILYKNFIKNVLRTFNLNRLKPSLDSQNL